MSQHLPTLGKCLAFGRRIPPIGAYHLQARRRYMPEPPLQEVLHGEREQVALPAPLRIGGLIIRIAEGDTLLIPGHHAGLRGPPRR